MPCNQRQKPTTDVYIPQIHFSSPLPMPEQHHSSHFWKSTQRYLEALPSLKTRFPLYPCKIPLNLSALVLSVLPVRFRLPMGSCTSQKPGQLKNASIVLKSISPAIAKFIISKCKLHEYFLVSRASHALTFPCRKWRLKQSFVEIVPGRPSIVV